MLAEIQDKSCQIIDTPVAKVVRLELDRLESPKLKMEVRQANEWIDWIGLDWIGLD